MKKMIISIITSMALVFGSIIAWCCYKDILTALLFILALVPSCLFEEGRQEYKAAKNGTRESL